MLADIVTLLKKKDGKLILAFVICKCILVAWRNSCPVLTVPLTGNVAAHQIIVV